MSRILLLTTTTGYQTQAFVEAAHRLGIELTFGSDRCHVLDDPWRDGALPLRFRDPAAGAKAIVEYATAKALQGIVCIGDLPTETAAQAAEALQINYHSPAAAAAARNKFLARQAFARAEIKVPSFARYPMDSDPETIVREVPFPCVLKPLVLSASRGVIRANTPAEFTDAFHRITALLKSPKIQVLRDEAASQIQVESYIEGQEVAVEGVMTDGRLKVLAIFDKPDPLCGPFFEETLYITPARLEADLQDKVITETGRACAALGLSHGPIHAELRFNSEGVWPLEIAGRPIGGLCGRALRFEGGIGLEELILKHAMGEDIDGIAREAQASGVMMVPIPEAGIFEGAQGVEEASRIGGVETVVITAKEGEPLVPLPEGAGYLGFIFARGGTPDSVEQSLRTAHSLLNFAISPQLSML